MGHLRSAGSVGPYSVPLGFVAVSFLGLMAVSFYPDLIVSVSLPSLRYLSQTSMLGGLLVPLRLLSYSFFPASPEAWGGAVVSAICMMLFASGRLSGIDYLRALAAGGVAGGIAFFFTGGPLIAGPGLAMAGLGGSCCVLAIRGWNYLGIPARLFGGLLLLGAAAALLQVLVHWDHGASFVRAAAVLAGFWVAARAGIGGDLDGSSRKAETARSPAESEVVP